MVGLIFLIVGLALLYWGYGNKKQSGARDKQCSQVVEAKCIKVSTRGVMEQGETHYFPVFQYDINGQTYTTDGMEGVSTIVNEGDTFSIYVNPSNPKQYCLVKGSSSILGMAALVFGAVFVLFGVCFILDI